MNRQQRRAQERLQQKMMGRVQAFRAANPMAEETFRQGYNEGWQAALTFAMKTCYAASVLALHDLEGFGMVRNTRFLRVMDEYVTTALTSEDIIDEALEKAGVKISFREAFTEDRIQNNRCT